MTDPANAGSQTGNLDNKATDKGTTEPSEAYKGLQRELNKVKDDLKSKDAEIARLKGEPSTEDELKALREERAKLVVENAAVKLMAKNPDVADLIEDFVNDTGKVPSELTIGKWKDRFKTKDDSEASEKSGVRNSDAQRKSGGDEDENKRTMRILETGHLWDN